MKIVPFPPEKEQANKHLVKCMKIEKIPTFKRKNHLQQRIQIQVGFGKVGLTWNTISDIEDEICYWRKRELISDRQKRIRLVDRNEHGQATEEEYEDDELADNSDDEKKFFKADVWARRWKRKERFQETCELV